MQAIRYDGQRLSWDRAVPVPVPEAGQVLIRPTLALLSPHDLAAAAGRLRVPAPLTPGYQFVGVIERPGDQARQPDPPGDHARVVAWPVISCQRCETCRRGLPMHCRARRHAGLTGWDGCLAERCLMPGHNLVPVPASLDDEQAVFAVPLARALHVTSVARVERKTYATVVGDTLEALLCAQVLSRRNAAVRLLGTRAARLAPCEHWNVRHRFQHEAGRRQDQDVVIEATGTPEGLSLALRLVRPRGRIVVCAPPTPGPGGYAAGAGASSAVPRGADHAGEHDRLMPAWTHLVEGEIELIGAWSGNLQAAIGALAGGQVDVTPLIWRRFRFTDALAAFAAAADPDHLGILIQF